MLELFNLLILGVFLFGFLLIISLVGYTIWFWLTDSKLYRSYLQRRRERLLNKFMEGLEK
jgi:hypothetical protein